MFGYVKPDKQELKVKEYETYKAVYCSLCKTLGKEYGIFAKALLTYDATFYVLFRKALLQNGPDCAHKGVCRFNPLKKCNYIDEDEILRTAAGLSVIMFYYKLLDNISDSGFIRKLGCRLLLPFATLKFKKAVKKYSYFNDIIKESVEKQEELERENCASVDRACDPSAKALGEIFSYGLENESDKQNAYRVGYCIGRYVYLTDALDDLEDDVKHSSYNVFANKYDVKKDLDEETLDGICGSIRMSIAGADTALDALKLNCYSSILKNVVFDGTSTQLNTLINKPKEGNNE